MRRKGVAYRKMLKSFLGVLLVPLCMSVAFFFLSQDVLEKQMVGTNENFVRTIRSSLDRELRYYQNTMYQLSMKSAILDASQGNYGDKQTKIALSKLTMQLSEVHASLGLLGNDCADIFVYFPETNLVFSSKASGSMQFENYMSMYFLDDTEEVEARKEALCGDSRFEMESVPQNKLGTNLVLMRCCAARLGNRSRATIGVWVNMDGLISRIPSVEWSDGYSWMILDGQSRVIIDASGVASPGEAARTEELEKRGEYLIYTDSSDIYDWDYALLIPGGVLQTSAGQIRAYFAICLLLSVIIASVLIVKMAEVNYRPLEELLRELKPNPEGNAPCDDEYHLLNRWTTELIDAKNCAVRNVSEATKPMMQWGLTSLVIRPYQPREGRDGSRLAEYAERFSQGENLVLLIKTQEKTTDPQSLPDTMKLFVVENIFLERMGEICYCEITELDDHQVMVLNGTQLPGKLPQIREAISELQGIVLEQLHFHVIVSCGAPACGPEGIHKSYLEAREAEEFIPLLEQDFMAYEDIRDMTCRGYRYSLQEEERISAAIRSDNGMLAIALIHKAIDNGWDEQTPLRIQRLLLNDIYCTLLKTADEKGCIDRIQNMTVKFSGRTVEEIKTAFSELVESICVTQQTEGLRSMDKTICEEVVAYVREHYSDPDLNVSQTAFHFHMSPANLSTVYRNEMGKSLLTFIGEVRIEKALEYLKEGYSVVETASLVGIPESSSFIRLFKKHMGVTPGKMKESFHSAEAE